MQTFIEQQYGFPNLSCKYLLRGVSDTYVLKNETGKYILKIYRDAHRSPEEIKGEAELITALENNGIHVAGLLKDTTGNKIQTFNAPEGTRYGMLFAFAKGKTDNNLTDNQVSVLGREMATMHNVTSAIELTFERPPYNWETLIYGPLRVLQPLFTEYDMVEEFEYLSETAHTLQQRLQQLDCDAFSTGYCHYDFFPKNFFFDEADNITIFDFDFAGKGWLANDLSSFHVHLFYHMVQGFISREEVDKILADLVTHYRSVRPFSDNEVRAIPALGFLLLLFYLRFQYENFDDWSNLFFGPRFVKHRIAEMRKYEAAFC